MLVNRTKNNASTALGTLWKCCWGCWSTPTAMAPGATHRDVKAHKSRTLILHATSTRVPDTNTLRCGGSVDEISMSEGRAQE